MKYISMCSGIEAASVAWKPLGWQPVWFSEVDPFCCELLRQRYPGVPNLGDMTDERFTEREEFRRATADGVDVAIGGTPCQSFSRAGKRAGLGDERGNLSLAFFTLASLSEARWVVWENVPGVLSANGGRDFRAILRRAHECGYLCAWRVLDAAGFGVPQRRRRVFLIGKLARSGRRVVGSCASTL